MTIRKLFFFLLLFCTATASAQELYVYTEPASNMPAYSVSPRLKAVFSKRENRPIFQRYAPELMLGVNKNLMVHVAATFANMHWNDIQWESVYTYAKYRFLSHDDVHMHFRMAVFAEGGYSRNPVYYDDVSLTGDNSGIGGGLIATQLINKLAVSGTAGYSKLLYNKSEHQFHDAVTGAVNYSLSAGYLILPFEYKNYDQLNFNVYTELLGQRNIGNGTWYLDLAPAIQFLIHSNSKINLGYRFQLDGNGERSMNKSFLVSFEHTLFNALRKKSKIKS